MLNVLATEKIARGWEKIIGKFQSQGAASFTQSYRVPQDAPGRVRTRLTLP